MKRETGSVIKKTESFERLHTVAAENYAMGWIASNQAWATGPAQLLAVELDTRFLESVNELAIAETASPAGSIDAKDPQPSHVPLALAAVPGGVLLGADKAFLRRPQQLAAAAAKPLHPAHEALFLPQPGNYRLGTWHVISSRWSR